MNPRTRPGAISLQLVAAVLLASFILSACGPAATAVPTAMPPTHTPTQTPIPPTHTPTATPTKTPTPTSTPNATATQHAQDMDAMVQSLFDKGYLSTTEGSLTDLFSWQEEWAQRKWYQWWPIGQKVSHFFLTGHFKWSVAQYSGDSGCGYVFALQPNGDHYAVFLENKKILFLDSNQSSAYSHDVRLTRGNGRVDLDDPTNNPVEADFTLIVNGTTAYVLVDGEFVGQYTLSENKTEGQVALTLLSGTNKDFGTRCEMTDLHLWTPSD